MTRPQVQCSLHECRSQSKLKQPQAQRIMRSWQALPDLVDVTAAARRSCGAARYWVNSKAGRNFHNSSTSTILHCTRTYFKVTWNAGALCHALLEGTQADCQRCAGKQLDGGLWHHWERVKLQPSAKWSEG